MTQQKLSAILKNSNISQEIATLYSDIHRLMDSSLEDREATLLVGEGINKKLAQLHQGIGSSHLKGILTNISDSLQTFQRQLLNANSKLEKQKKLHDDAVKILVLLENYTGKLIIREKMAGEDTKYAEQLLMLIIGFEESLLQIDRLFSKETINYYSSNKSVNIKPAIQIADDLSLRLNTLTASEAEVQSNAKNLILKVRDYKKNLTSYEGLLKRLVSQRQQLEVFLKQMLREIKVLDVAISHSATGLNKSVVKTVFFSTLVVFILIIVTVGILGYFIFGLVNSMGIEISKRKAAQNELIQSETRLKTLSDASFEGIFFVEKEICKDLNQTAERLIGSSRKKAIGKPLTEWIIPEDREKALNNITSGREKPYEIGTLRKDGTSFPCEVQARVVRNEKSTFQVIAIRNISARKKAESEKEKALLFAAEQKKLSLVGQVAGKMAHDFNNVLATILGNSEIALMDCKDDEIKETLELIRKQTLRGRNLTKNLVAFALDNEPKQQFFHISDKIDLVLNLIERDLEGIRIQRKEDIQLPELLADPGMIEHMLINILHNSIHALSKTDSPLITIRAREQQGLICLEVEDNGCGIPEEHLESVFDPAFTLKGSKDFSGTYSTDIKGTGYGLANVKKYIIQHNGEIRIDSSINAGTRVVVSFPVVHKQLTTEEKAEISTSISHEKKSILVVEDEPSILDVQRRILSEPPLNHLVDVASNGKTAIEMFNTKAYDLISLDYILPGGQSGMDVYTYIRSKTKTTPVLFISGNIEFLESLKQIAHKDPLVAHLSKPCQNIEYINAINQLLESKERTLKT